MSVAPDGLVRQFRDLLCAAISTQGGITALQVRHQVGISAAGIQYAMVIQVSNTGERFKADLLALPVPPAVGQDAFVAVERNHIPVIAEDRARIIKRINDRQN